MRLFDRIVGALTARQWATVAGACAFALFVVTLRLAQVYDYVYSLT